MKTQTLEKNDYSQELAEDGFVILKNAISTEKIRSLVSVINLFKELNPEPWLHATDNDGLARRIVNLHLALPNLSESLGECKLLYDIALKFFCKTPRIYTSLFFEGGSQQPIHRDTPYFTTEPEGNFLGVWLALEDASPDNGALEVIRGGHLAGEPNRQEIASKLFPDLSQVPSMDDQLWNAYQSSVIDLCATKGLSSEVVSVNAGDIIIWHPDLPHGGSAILKPGMSRKSIVFHITPRHCPVHQMDTFFNPSKQRELASEWKEFPSRSSSDEDILYVAETSDEVSFAHVYNAKIVDLCIP